MSLVREVLLTRLDVTSRAATRTIGGGSTCAAMKQNTPDSKLSRVQFVVAILGEGRARRACKSCHTGKSRCEGGVPCDECLRRGIQCLFDDNDTIETKRPASSDLASSPGQGRVQSTHFEKKEQYIGLYFKKFHRFWPFIHRGSFNIHRETPLLLQSMTVLGLWCSGEQPSRSAAVELHEKLHLAIRDQKANWDVSDKDEFSSTLPWPISTYQAILLHIIFSLILRSRDALDFEFKVSLSPADTELLEALVRSCRKRGMLFYPNMLTRFKEVGLASFAWVCTEEVKRFNLALYKACGKLSSTQSNNGSHNSPDSSDSLLSAGDLQFPLPKNDVLWNALGKSEWLVLVQDETTLCVDDNCQEPWISSMAGVFECLRL
ncbi:uncharacterized protein N7477_007995 [Penicillium maclennaniae]|uniref:uncharacterized protein n=1 Tax=Penicillium maclennaniae TaxID=1343394 RepID=UPI0025425788|nr:uncharacterized protein N7477_007995 [Penicillium maclennaniae]KAJ5665547.1 hypothetical protein N7477_007995 [Penicillium maclennaniae]